MQRTDNVSGFCFARFLGGLGRIRSFLFFVILYSIVNLVYLSNFKVWGYDSAALFLTSPFNPLEIASSGYVSYTAGEILNFGLVCAIILGADIYYQFFTIRLKRYLSPWVALVFAIAASYILSASLWLMTKTPSTGTSVIGFSMALFVAILSVADFQNYQRRRLWAHREQAPGKLKVLGYVFILVLSWTAVFTLFIIGNPHYDLHLLGGAIFAVIIGLYIKFNPHLSGQAKQMVVRKA